MSTAWRLWGSRLAGITLAETKTCGVEKRRPSEVPSTECFLGLVTTAATANPLGTRQYQFRARLVELNSSLALADECHLAC
jgi:hypothetical protein